MRNFTVQQAEFNAVYVLETDGFVIDRLTTRGNDEYGILAFASDHGLIQRTDNYFNGDSGIYPGSGADLNADNPDFEPTRYAIEIRHNKSHDNTLGYSGTAGNSIYAHHNEFYDNATGISTDSLFPGPPRASPRTTRAGRGTRSTPTTRTTTPSSSTRACATSRCPSAATSTAPSARSFPSRWAPAC